MAIKDEVFTAKPKSHPPPPIDEAKAVRAAIEQSKAQLDAGLLGVPGDGKALAFKLVIMPACHWGDADILVRDVLMAQQKKQILLSLEPLQGYETAFKPIVQRLDLADLNHGVSGRLSLPTIKAGVPAGLFICTDSSSAGRCAAKEMGDLQEALAAPPAFVIGGVKGSKGVRGKADRIYFFQAMLIDQNGAKIQTATRSNPAAGRNLERYLSSDSNVGDRKAKAVRDSFTKLNSNITSVPVTYQDGGLRLVMYTEDTPHCQPLKPTGVAAGREPPWSPKASVVDVSAVKIPPSPH